MTTPTREQVVQWALGSGLILDSHDKYYSQWMRQLATLARADLEAENAEMREEITALCIGLNEKDAELKSLRKVIQLAADDIRRCDYTPARSKLLTAIAAAPKEN